MDKRIPWKEKFDMVISLCFTGNKVRVPPLDKELDRVGLPVDLRIWNVPSPFELTATLGLRSVRSMIESAGFRNSGFGHYRAIRTAYDLGANRALIIEDDIRFLKDVDALADIVKNTPDASIVLFDLLKAGQDDTEAIKRQLDRSRMDGWADPTDRPCSFACYGLNRDGMRHLLGCFEGAFDRRWAVHIVDHYMHAQWRRVSKATVKVAWPLACIQVPMAGSPNNTGIRFHHGDNMGQTNWYRSIGLDPKDYAPA